MYTSNEVSKYLGVQHKQLLQWCDEYYEEFGKDKNYDVDIELKKYKNGTRYYLIGMQEISGFGARMNNKKGLRFLQDIKYGYFDCDIDNFLNINTRLKIAIRENITNIRLYEGFINDGKYYYHYTTLIYSVLKIEVETGVNPRDVLDKRTLIKLEEMEEKIADMIEKYSKDLHYKDVYKKIKDEVEK